MVRPVFFARASARDDLGRRLYKPARAGHRDFGLGQIVRQPLGRCFVGRITPSGKLHLFK